MSMLARIVPNTIKATAIFAAVAFVVVVLPGGSGHDILTRIMSDLPPLLTLSAVVVLAVNLAAAAGGAIVGGSELAAAVVAGLIGWGATRFGALGISELGQSAFAGPALVAALAIPWLLGSSGSST